VQMRLSGQLVLLGIASCLIAQENTVLNEDMKLLHFIELDYPLSARLSHVQGVVAVRVTLDAEGIVKSATAISGPKLLIQDSIENAKKWQFKAGSGRAAVIIYHFKIEGLCNLPCRSQFSFWPPNLAVITMGEAVLDH